MNVLFLWPFYFLKPDQDIKQSTINWPKPFSNLKKKILVLKYNVHNYIPSLLPFETVYSMFCNTTVCSHILLNWFSQLYKLIWYIPSCLIQTSLNLLRSCQSFGLTDMKILSVWKIFCRSEKKVPKNSLSHA